MTLLATRRTACCASLFLLASVAILSLGCAATSYAAPSADRVPPDAVIKLWQQEWIHHGDGTVLYHEKQHVQLNNDRAYGEFADPRITYNADSDQLKILSARVRRADGTYRELPDYSHVKVSPGPTAGWPAFASIRQHLLVMSGIEPGCVVELEYQVTSAPGTREFAGDIRLDHHYPVEQRIVRVQGAGGVALSMGDLAGPHPELKTLPANIRQITLDNLPARPREPHAPPRSVICPRLVFSAAASAESWTRDVLNQISDAAQPTKLIEDLVAEWTRTAKTPSTKLAAIHKHLDNTFTVLDFPAAWRPQQVRTAAEVLDGGYGLPAEAAVVLLACTRAAGLDSKPGLLTNDEAWSNDAPQHGLIAAYVVTLGMVDEMQRIWDLPHGEITRNAHWAGHTLHTIGDAGVQAAVLPAWTDADDSRLRITGALTIADDGTCAGTLTLRTTGLFVSAADLRTEDDQKHHINRLLDHTLPLVTSDRFSIEKLTDDVFAATVHVSSRSELSAMGPYRALTFDEFGPAAVNITLPLSASQRKTPVWLPGPFDEQVDITIEWPETWRAVETPTHISTTVGDECTFEQKTTQHKNSLRFTRHLRITTNRIAPELFDFLRGDLNNLRTTAARTILLQPE